MSSEHSSEAERVHPGLGPDYGGRRATDFLGSFPTLYPVRTGIALVYGYEY
jgi:hypothetical protein